MRGGSRQERRWSNCIGCWFVVVVVVDVVDDGVVILVNLFVGRMSWMRGG